jgi:arylsulfatase A-like enzyme
MAALNQLTQSRRDFLKTAAVAALGPHLLPGRRKEKPNLLFIWTDEQRADTMRVYGNSKIQTPNLNKFADENVVFENAYVSQTVCTPSRSTVLTGLWPHQNGCTENNLPLAPHFKCLPEILNDSNYRTGYFGKWHLGDEIFAQHGFEEWQSIEDGYRKYYRPERDLNRKSAYWHFLKNRDFEPDTASGDFSRGRVSRLPIEHSKTQFLERQAIDFLSRHQRDPFLLHINFLEPHMPFSGPLNDLHSAEAIELPASYFQFNSDREPLRYQLIRERYRQKGFEGNDLKTEAGWQRLLANYWGLVAQVDRSVGAILAALERLKLAENTIVVYTSDHGDMMSAHRLLAKTVMYEEAARVPWLLRFPARIRQQVFRPRVSHIDLIPTLLELMRQPIPENLPGKSLVPLLAGKRPVDPEIFLEWNPANRISRIPEESVGSSETQQKQALTASIRTVITQDGWKLCRSNLDYSQLFNLQQDPGELTNLYYQPAYQSKILELEEKIRAWQNKTNDPLRF